MVPVEGAVGGQEWTGLEVEEGEDKEGLSGGEISGWGTEGRDDGVGEDWLDQLVNK